jgi:omega-6 fatty acid desaturase (delta-12 desaturase)
MYFSLRVSYALTLLLAVPAAGFLVRIFIFFHDCGHGSFFSDMKTNRRVGFWLGVLVFTPGEEWWHSHAVHHATNSNLDRRGKGDVDTWTVKEYQTAPPLKRLGYRLMRHPLIFLGLGPIGVFLLANRRPAARSGKKERSSVYLTDLAILAVAATASLLIGFKEYVLIQLPVIWMAGAVGIWMFYVQHQFDGMYWVRGDKWDYISSALLGASCYNVPRLLRWFTGNIGFHHIHHLNPRIPNYELYRCYRANPPLQEYPTTLHFGKAFHCVNLNLWDEEQQKLVSFADLKKQPA